MTAAFSSEPAGVAAPGALQAEQSPEVIVRRRGAETAMRREAVPTYAQYLQRARATHPDRGSSVGDEIGVSVVPTSVCPCHGIANITRPSEVCGTMIADSDGRNE